MILIEAEIFNRTMRPHSAITGEAVEGPLTVAHSAISQLVRTMNELLAASLPVEKIPKVYLNISQNNAVNAGVRKLEDGYVVYVSAGLLHRIWNLTTAYISLSQAGSQAISLLQAMKAKEELALDFSSESGTLEAEGFFFRVTKPNEELHSWIFERAIQLCVLHELSHIYGGHFQGAAAISDTGQEPGRTTSANRKATQTRTSTKYFQHLLELDADTVATEIMIKSKLWDDIWLRRLMRGLGDSGLVDFSIEDRLTAALTLITASQCLVISALYSDRLICGTMTKKHPREIVRLCNIQYTYYCYASKEVLKFKHIDAALDEIHAFMMSTRESNGLFPSVYDAYFSDAKFNKLLRYVARRREQIHLSDDHPLAPILTSEKRIARDLLRRLPWPDAPSLKDQNPHAKEMYELRLLNLLMETDGTSKYLNLM